MGFFSNIISATVKVVLTPVASIVKGDEPDNTKDLLTSAGEDLSDAVDEACGG